MKECNKCLCFECSLNDRRNRIKCDTCIKCKKKENFKGIKDCTFYNRPDLFAGPAPKERPKMFCMRCLCYDCDRPCKKTIKQTCGNCRHLTLDISDPENGRDKCEYLEEQETKKKFVNQSDFANS